MLNGGAAYPAEEFSSSEGYDPQNTMLALNMAVVSVHRILATQSRAVLDDEYQNIINNLSLGNIRSDPEITALYEKLLDITSRKKLRTDESARLRKELPAQHQTGARDGDHLHGRPVKASRVHLRVAPAV